MRKCCGIKAPSTLLLCTFAQVLPSSEAGWNPRVPPNRAAGPWHPAFRSWDSSADGLVRDPGHSGVAALQAELATSNCQPEVRVLSPDAQNYTAEALHLLRRDGFVVVEDALKQEQLSKLRNATERILGHILAVDPDGDFGGGAGKLPYRYSLGDASATRANFHVPEYCDLIDLPSTTRILRAIFDSDDYWAAGAGGDVVLDGALEYQALHMDAIWGALPGVVQDHEIPPVVTVNFVLHDLGPTSGPMRKVRGSHRWKTPPPTLGEEPAWMKFSTLCPLRAGSAIIRDNRCWHGGTPNLSDRLRALPNIEYFAPGGQPSLGWLDRATMPFENWQRLSPFAQHLARGVVAPPGTEIHGAGLYAPWAILELMPFMVEQ